MLEPTIEQRLRAARRRLARRALYRSLLLAAGAGFAVLALAIWVNWHLWPAAAAAGAVLLISLASQLARLPDDLELARRSDFRFGLQERMSTAVEISRRGTSGGLDHLQLRDAAAHVHKVRPAELVTLQPGMTNWLIAGTGAVLLTVALLVPGPGETIPASLAPRDTAALGETIADLRLVADSLSDEAGAQEDQQLASLALTLDDLSQQLQQDEFNHSELLEELTSLAGQLEEIAARQSQPEITQDSETPESPLASSAPASRNEEPENGEGIAESAEDSMQAAPQFMEPDPQMLARLEERRQQFLAAESETTIAASQGLSQQSTTEDGDTAGEVGEEDSGALTAAEVDFGFAGEEINLPFTEDPLGQRSTVEASPDIVLSETAGDIIFNPSHWQVTAETALDPAQTGLRQQAAVARYFLPPDAGN